MASVIINKKSNFIVRFMRAYLKEFTLFVGLGILVLFILTALLAPWISPYQPDEQDLMNALQPPSLAHIFGTDELGRDILTRVIYASRTDLYIAIASVTFAYIIALPFGLSAGYFGGRIDRLISTLSESVLVFPSIVLSIIIVSIIGSGTTGLIITIMILQTPQLIRYLRGFAYQIRDMEYIQAAKAAGSRNLYILIRHVLRNTLGPTMVIISLLASEAVLIVAALGFLGMGVQPPTPEWGTMLSRSRNYFLETPHLMIFPGIAIALLILSFNLLGDGIRDYLDTKK